MNDMVVWVADVGSIKKKHFGWYRGVSHDDGKHGTDIGEFADGIVEDLNNEKKVAIGFECPLFVPITDEPEDLTTKRRGEYNRPWSAGAGCCSLATGLTECVWIFERIKKKSKVDVKPTFSWKDFRLNESNFFIWEAFVSSLPKEGSNKDWHWMDAQKAVNIFLDYFKISPHFEDINCVSAQHPYSLVGAGLLRAGLTTNLNLLSEQCIVIKT